MSRTASPWSTPRQYSQFPGLGPGKLLWSVSSPSSTRYVILKISLQSIRTASAGTTRPLTTTKCVANYLLSVQPAPSPTPSPPTNDLTLLGKWASSAPTHQSSASTVSIGWATKPPTLPASPPSQGPNSSPPQHDYEEIITCQLGFSPVFPFFPP